MGERIRVLELIKGLDVGGAEVLLVERLSAADPTDVVTELAIVDGRRTALIDEVMTSVDKLHVLGRSGFRSPTWPLRLAWLLRRRTYDVVHVHSPAVAVVLRVIRRVLRGRWGVVNTEHSVAYRPLTMRLNRATIRWDDHVIAVSRAVAQAECISATQAPVTVLTHGVNLEALGEFGRLRDETVDEFSLAPAPRVVTVANLRPEKDLINLIRAAAQVGDSRPDVTFYLVGTGPEEGRLRDAIRQYGVEGTVVLMGSISRAARLTSCADVFVLSSIHEGQPVAVMEALGCGVPVVATDVGGMSELVEHGVSGLLVPSRDPAALAQALLLVLEDDTLRRTLADGAARAGAGLDIRATASAIQDIYHETVAASRRRAS